MNEEDEMVIAPTNPNMEVLTHGVKVDLNTSMYWMQLNLSYPDGFIYLSFLFTHNTTDKQSGKPLL